MGEILSNENQRNLWIDYFGLASCAFIVPSDLFVTPVPCRFAVTSKNNVADANLDDVLSGSTSLHKRAPLSVRRRRWASNTPYSFFGGNIPSDEVIQVHFVGERLSSMPRVRSHKASLNTLLVSDSFLDYLQDSAFNIPYSSSELYNPNDHRLKVFMARNGDAIQHIFGVGTPLVGPDSYLPLEPYIEALEELIEVAVYTRNGGPHIYLIPGNDDGNHPGLFCFIFRSTVDSTHRALLRFTCDRLLRFIRAADRFEIQRRTVLLHGQLAATHADLHNLRTAMATLFNKLQIIQMSDNTHAHASEALDIYSNALSHIDKLETAALSTATSHSASFTMSSLRDIWLNQWGITHLELNISPEHLSDYFTLSGSAIDLGAALFQFIEDPRDLDEPSTSQYFTLDQSPPPIDHWEPMSDDELAIAANQYQASFNYGSQAIDDLYTTEQFVLHGLEFDPMWHGYEASPDIGEASDTIDSSDHSSPTGYYDDLSANVAEHSAGLDPATIADVEHGDILPPTEAHESPGDDSSGPTPDSYGDTVLHMHIDQRTSELCLFIRHRIEFSIEVQEAITSVNILGRLPSDKPSGGRGILSAITTIRNQYRGKCTFINPWHVGPSWTIRLPIKMFRPRRSSHQRP